MPKTQIKPVSALGWFSLSASFIVSNSLNAADNGDDPYATSTEDFSVRAIKNGYSLSDTRRLQGRTYSLQTESAYDWENSQWNISVNAVLSKIVRIGQLSVSIAGGVRYWDDAPERGAEDWGLRFAVTAMLSKQLAGFVSEADDDPLH